MLNHLAKYYLIIGSSPSDPIIKDKFIMYHDRKYHVEIFFVIKFFVIEVFIQ